MKNHGPEGEFAKFFTCLSKLEPVLCIRDITLSKIHINPMVWLLLCIAIVIKALRNSLAEDAGIKREAVNKNPPLEHYWGVEVNLK